MNAQRDRLLYISMSQPINPHNLIPQCWLFLAVSLNSKLYIIVAFICSNQCFSGIEYICKMMKLNGWQWVFSSDCRTIFPLQWRHNGHHSVSYHQPRDCLLNRLFWRRSKKTSKLCVTGICAGKSPGTGEFSTQIASKAENVSIWWRRHVCVDFWTIVHIFHDVAVINVNVVIDRNKCESHSLWYHDVDTLPAFCTFKFILLSAWISCWISSRVVGNLWSHYAYMKSLLCKSHVVIHMIEWFHIIFNLDQLCWYYQCSILISEKFWFIYRQIKALYHYIYIYIYKDYVDCYTVCMYRKRGD